MLDNIKSAQEIYNLNKNYWMMTTEMMTAWQKQNEKVWNTLLEQGLMNQQDGKKMLQDWLNGIKQTQEKYNKLVEESWSKAETVFNSIPKTSK